MVRAMNAQSAEEQSNPYGSQQAQPRRRTRIVHLQRMKDAGQKWAMLTSYDQFTASIFDEAGIPALLVGDSAGNNVYGLSLIHI